jgi:hypothetical protein
LTGKHNGILRFWAVLDNFEPPRSETNGQAEIWRHPDGHEVIKIVDAPAHFKDGHNAIYLLDDGNTVVPYYVVGWNDKAEPVYVLIQPFPANPDGAATRPDNGQPIDYSTWALGPRRAYHLKVRREMNEEN